MAFGMRAVAVLLKHHKYTPLATQSSVQDGHSFE